MRRFGLALAALLAAPGALAAAATIAQVQPGPALGKGLEALPRLLGATPAIAKINAALQSADARALKAARECIAQGKANGLSGDWTRQVETAFANSRLIAFVVRDEIYCGGAHPDNDVFALVYDLADGDPVDWKKRLPSDLAITSQADQAADGTRLGLVVSAKLSALYIAGVMAGRGADPDCREALEAQPLTFVVWPDAKAGGLTLATNSLPHAAQACGEDYTIKLDSLRGRGIAAALFEGMAQAARAKPAK